MESTGRAGLVVKLFGSFNSRFYACLTPTEVRLYRGISAGGGMTNSNEAQLVFARALDESLELELLRVSNTGDMFFLNRQGLFRLKNDRNAKLDIVDRTLCAYARNEENKSLGRVRVDADGREICYEVISREVGINSLRKWLGGRTHSESTLAHHVAYLNLGNQRPLNFPPTVVDTRREHAFRWSTSPSGRFLVQARPEKKSYHLDVIDVTDESIVADFQMALANIHDIWVNDAGVMMVDVRQIGEEKLILALPDGVTRCSFCPPPSYRVVHLGPLHVGVMLEAQKRLQVYDYPGNLVSDVDCQPLRQMGVEFGFNFNDRGQIDVMIWQAGYLHLQHADLKSIVVDAKRWELSARQQQADTENNLIREATQHHIQDRKNFEDVHLSRQLLEAVQAENPMPSRAQLPRVGGPQPQSPLPPPVPALPRIPEIPSLPPSEMPAGATELPPWMAGLSQPPNPLPREAAVVPPPRPTNPLPREAAVVPPPRPTNPLPPEASVIPPPRPIHPLVREAAVVPPPRPVNPVPPLESAASAPPPLEFLRGGSLPPPDTEIVEEASPPTSAKNLAEVDAELERLRMTYIAGEISREGYYSRRAELESSRRSLSITNSIGPGPKRLDIDFDSGTSGSPTHPPVSRRKPSGPGLSLELPLPGEDE